MQQYFWLASTQQKNLIFFMSDNEVNFHGYQNDCKGWYVLNTAKSCNLNYSLDIAFRDKQ